MIFNAKNFGRVEKTLSFVVKHSFTISRSLTTIAGFVPRRIEKIGPYLSAMAPSVLCSSWFLPPRRCRWPITGHAPATSGGLLPFFLFRLANFAAKKVEIIAKRRAYKENSRSSIKVFMV
uniref:Uncharacterized protein n=1 Tax=Salix viminalis TaxID=40686 RepID=A0A6N2LJN9_SALVM